MTDNTTEVIPVVYNYVVIGEVQVLSTTEPLSNVVSFMDYLLKKHKKLIKANKINKMTGVG